MAIATDQNISNEGVAVLNEPDEDEVADDDAEGGAAEAAQPSTPSTKQGNQPVRNGVPKQSRQQRRGESLNAVQERVLKAVDERFNGFAGQFQQMLAQAQRAAAPQQQAPAAQPQVDPYTQRLGELSQAKQAELAAFRAHDHSKSTYDMTRYNQIEEAMNSVREQRVQAVVEARINAQLQKMQPQRETYGREAQYTARFYEVQKQFPWIHDAKYAGAVRQYREYLVGVGRVDDLNTDLEACAHVQAELGLAPRGGAPRAAAAPYQAIQGGARAGGSGPRSMALPPAALHGLSADELEMARRTVFSGE